MLDLVIMSGGWVFLVGNEVGVLLRWLVKIGDRFSSSQLHPLLIVVFCHDSPSCWVGSMLTHHSLARRMFSFVICVLVLLGCCTRVLRWSVSSERPTTGN